MSDVINRAMMPCEAKFPINSPYLPRVTIWKICDQAATETWRYACIHEHVKEGQTCPAHRPEPGAVGCAQCWELGHECPMTAEPVVTE